MVISVIGECDKRPFIYTLLHVCQYLGDVLFVTNDEAYAEFIEDNETIKDCISGHFQDIFMVVTDMTPDECHQVVGYDNEDYEFIIYDNKMDTSGEVIIYISNGEMTDLEREEFTYLSEDDYTTINYGGGKKKVIKKSKKIDSTCELIEERKALQLVDSQITNRILGILSAELEIPAKTLRKAVSK